jgi:hypothetical protein
VLTPEGRVLARRRVLGERGGVDRSVARGAVPLHALRDLLGDVPDDPDGALDEHTTDGDHGVDQRVHDATSSERQYRRRLAPRMFERRPGTGSHILTSIPSHRRLQEDPVSIRITGRSDPGRSTPLYAAGAERPAPGPT